jgi:hypothetical protein
MEIDMTDANKTPAYIPHYALANGEIWQTQAADPSPHRSACVSGANQCPVQRDELYSRDRS